MSAPVLWVVAPVFLDVPSFQQLRCEVQATLSRSAAGRFAALRFVAIDDTGGIDPQMDALRGMESVTVVAPPFTLGHQRAIVFALRSLAPAIADDDVIVTLDADGEDRPEDLPRLLAPLLDDADNPHKIVLARRTKRRERLPFKLLYLCFRLLFRWLTGTVVRSGNYAAYRGWLTHQIMRHPHFDLCYSSTFLSLNLDVEFVPCERGRRYTGESRMSYGKLMMHGMRMLMPFTDRIAIRALIAFSVTFAIGIVLSAVVVGIRLFTDRAIPGWATSTLLLVLILSFIALGNFIVLFAVFSQSRGVSLQDIEMNANGRTRVAPPTAD